VSAAHLELAKAFAAFAHQNLRGKSITASTSSSSSSQKEEGEEEALFDLDAHLVRAREVNFLYFMSSEYFVAALVYLHELFDTHVNFLPYGIH